MTSLRNACFFLMFLFTHTAFGSCLFQDKDLIQKLEEKKITLIALRHNESLNNFKNIVVSSRSPGYSLTSTGLEDLRSVSQEFISKGIDAIYTSPLYRSLQATQILGGILKLSPDKLMLDDRLRIQNFGTYEGKSYEDYTSLFPSFQEMLEGSAPAGESGYNLFQRTRTFLWKVANGHNKTVLLVTHAFNLCHINMCLKGEFGDLPLEGEYVTYDFSH